MIMAVIGYSITILLNIPDYLDNQHLNTLILNFSSLSTSIIGAYFKDRFMDFNLL